MKLSFHTATHNCTICIRPSAFPPSSEILKPEPEIAAEQKEACDPTWQKMDYDPMAMDEAEALGPVIKISQVGFFVAQSESARPPARR